MILDFGGLPASLSDGRMAGEDRPARIGNPREDQAPETRPRVLPGAAMGARIDMVGIFVSDLHGTVASCRDVLSFEID